MALIILITSFKGGVGKSTAAANIASKLARSGKRTLLCDLDFDLGTLDLITGCEDRVLFDVCDAVSGKRDADDCTVKFPSNPNLFLLPAPFKNTDAVEPGEFAEKLKEICDKYDYAILDTPGADSPALSAAKTFSDLAIVVSTHNPTSIRGAEKTAESLRENGVECRLLINCFDAASVSEDRRAGILSMIDATKTPLLGVIPYDRTLMFAQEKGVLADGGEFISSKAFDNTVQRLLCRESGERPTPILRGVGKVKRKKVLTK